MAERESAPKNPGKPTAAATTAADVAEYLRQHPEFLAENPDLLEILIPPEHRRGDRVLDMQRYMLERLRNDQVRLRTEQSELLAATRGNLSSQGRVHAAIVAMLQATTLEHLIEIVVTDLAMHIEVDAIALGFEALDRVPPGGNATALKILPRGAIDRLMGGGKDIVLFTDQPGDAMLFGGGATLVRSQALVRMQLRRDAPLGLLALGARTPGKFHSGQGTELLSFLGRVVELSIRGWLDRD
ncbi:MAG: DUF484 family protein [Rhodospirillales bacterium]|nr:DUF484 family protein [Rhodospirillales bacterium]